MNPVDVFSGNTRSQLMKEKPPKQGHRLKAGSSSSQLRRRWANREPAAVGSLAGVNQQEAKETQCVLPRGISHQLETEIHRLISLQSTDVPYSRHHVFYQHNYNQFIAKSPQVKGSAGTHPTTHLYNIYTDLIQRRRRRADVV